MRIGARITSGVWVSIPFTFMGFMMGGWILAIVFMFASLFLWPAFVVDFLKTEAQEKAFLKVCGTGYLLVGLYGLFFEPMKKATSVYPGYEYSGWYFITIFSLIVSIAYFVVGFDLNNRKQNVKPESKLLAHLKNKSHITPREFEQLVAEHYQNEGYETEITPYSGDYGVDIIAQKGEERIAIQAKMYGNSARKVNRETVMQLFGAMTYRQCNKAVIATDGTCMTDAIEVANRLGVEILYLNSTDIIVRQHEELENEKVLPTTNIDDAIPFDEMWKRYIMPLSGRTITNDGLTNKIISVDWGGLKRMTSKGNIGKISIEEFQLAYELLVKNGSVERVLINQHAKRCSSGIVLVLSQVPFIGVQNKPKTMLYLKGNK